MKGNAMCTITTSIKCVQMFSVVSLCNLAARRVSYMHCVLYISVLWFSSLIASKYCIFQFAYDRFDNGRKRATSCIRNLDESDSNYKINNFLKKKGRISKIFISIIRFEIGWNKSLLKKINMEQFWWIKIRFLRHFYNPSIGKFFSYS